MMRCRRLLYSCLVLALLIACIHSQQHTSNHAVILSSSRFWMNYRHVVNALSIYKLVKQNGIPDENIILMLADEIPTNPRSVSKNSIYNNLYDENTEIDYRGDEVTVDNLVKVLLGRHEEGEADSRRLHSDETSNLLIYWTGHGGDNFFKFQDVEEITSADIRSLFAQMHVSGRYKEILFIADTCQAFTLGDKLDDTTPNVYFIGSSLKNENAYARHSDQTLGLSVIERYTYAITEYVTFKRDIRHLTLKEGLVDHLSFRQLQAHIGYTDAFCSRKLENVPMTDFFAHVGDDVQLLYDVPSPSEKVAARQTEASTTASINETTETTTCSAMHDASPKYQGVEPTDSLFIAFVLFFIGTVMLVSQFV